jgi:hypothetical protein
MGYTSHRRIVCSLQPRRSLLVMTAAELAVELAPAVNHLLWLVVEENMYGMCGYADSTTYSVHVKSSLCQSWTHERPALQMSLTVGWLVLCME